MSHTIGKSMIHMCDMYYNQNVYHHKGRLVAMETLINKVNFAQFLGRFSVYLVLK